MEISVYEFFLFIVFACFLYHPGNFCTESLLSSVFGGEKISKSQEKETGTKEEISEPGTSHKPFTLINQNNEPEALDSLIGKPLLMSFIYSRCSMPPDHEKDCAGTKKFEKGV